MAQLRNQLLAKFHVLISQRGIDKEHYLWSNYGIDSARQLSDEQLSQAINNIEGRENRPTYTSYISPEIKKMRSEILALLTRSPSAHDVKKRGLGVPNDWEYLNPFIAKYTGGRMLNDKSMMMADLMKLKSQMLAMRSKGYMWGVKAQEADKIEEIPIMMRAVTLPS